MSLTRRSFVAAAVGSLTVYARTLTAQNSALSFTQYHNQTPASSLHQRLVAMWAAIEEESRGRIRATVFAQNNNCLLYTSDAADERSSVDLGGRRIIKKKKKRKGRR